jgi:peptidyl-prolyl cis-trans isomerase B (cyclophilin B)
MRATANLGRAMPAAVVALVVGALTLVACGDDGESASANLPRGCEEVAKPPPKQVDLAPPKRKILPGGERITAVVRTSCGSFDIVLDTARSPKTVASFTYLVERGVYDDTIFHKIVPGFVIQGGDPQGTGTGGPGYSVDEAPRPSTVYRRGTVAMAKTAAEPPGRSGSQFFVVVAPAQANLPPHYALLGEVTSGMDVVERIASLGDPAGGEEGTPTATVLIRGITLRGG